MNYLARLKDAQFENVPPVGTAFTAKNLYGGFGSTQGGPISEIKGVSDPVTHRHWFIHFPALDVREMLFIPPVTLAQAADTCPGAIAAVSVQDPPRVSSTPTEAGVLRAPVALILPDASDAQWAEVLAAACADPEATLPCWRSLAADLDLAPPDPFAALPNCRQCRNLANVGRCAASAPEELRYVACRSDEPTPDIGRRCEHYLSGPAYPDRRTARARCAHMWVAQQTTSGERR